MSKFTPGPWVALIDGESTWGGDSHCIVAGEHSAGIADVMIECEASTHGEDGVTRVTQEQGIANAHLIAAAPDLLEACQTFAEWLRREDEGLPAGIERGTPEGERQWRIWWDENLRICNLAQEQVRAAIAKATGAGHE